MRKIWWLAAGLFLLPVLAGCRAEPTGPCAYVDIPGECTIMAVMEPSADAMNCSNDPVEVRFDFIPDDLDAREDYRFPNMADERQLLTVAGGANPPRTWVEDEGLTEGSRHACVRREITRGTCTPVLFEFTGVDTEAAADQCY